MARSSNTASSESDITSVAESRLEFDDGTLRAIADVYLQDGNNAFRKNELSNAIYFYMEGIQANCKDDVLNAKLYSNRAAALFYSGNYKETLNDARAAVKLETTLIEAIEIGAAACVQLQCYTEAITWCDKGLVIDDKNNTLVDLRSLSVNCLSKLQETPREKVKSVEETKTIEEQENANYSPETLKEVEDKSEEGRAWFDLGNACLRRGDFKKAIDFHECHLKIAVKKGDRDKEGKSYCNIGIAYYSLGDLKKAIDYHQRYLTITKELKDREGEGMAYCNLGNDYYSLGDFNKAIEYHERDLTIANEEEDIAGEGRAYCNLGNAYYRLGDCRKAIHYHERHLEIEKEVGDRPGEGKSYCNLGNAYYSLGDFQKAMDYHERDLKIAKEVEDRAGEGRAYGNLGNACFSQGDFEKAIEYHENHLKIAKEMEARTGEGRAYGNLGNAYYSLGDFKKAIEYHERHQKIAKELEDKDGVGKSCCNLGNAYYTMGNYNKAIEYHERHLRIAKEMKDKPGEGRAYGNLGNVCYSMGNFRKAIKYHERHLNIAKEVEDRAAEGRVYCNLANDYYSLGDLKRAIDYYELDLKIAKEVKDRAGEGGAYGGLGLAYDELGEFRKSIDYHKNHLTIAKEVGDKAGEGRAYGNLGNAYSNLEEFEMAIEYHEHHLKIAKEVEEKAGEGRAYGNLGNAYQRLGNFRKAVDYHESHLGIAKELEDRSGEGKAYGNLGTSYLHLGDLEKATDYQERSLKIAKEVGDKAGEAKSFFRLGQSYELQRSPLKALECYQSSVNTFDDVRDNLQFKDEWKISFRNLYQTVYKSLWQLLLKQDKVVEALFAAEQGRAQALKDLMEFNYGFETADFELYSPETSTYDSFNFLPSNTVFIAINEREIVFWVIQNGKDVELRRNKFSGNISPDLIKFFQSLTEMASEQIGVRSGIKCEDRSLDELVVEEKTKERSPQTRPNPVHHQTNVLRTFYDVIIGPIADLVRDNELIVVPEGPLCLAPYAAFVCPDSRYLCESFRIRVIPSLTSLKLIADCRSGYHSKTGVLLVGDPWVQEVVYRGKVLEQLPCARDEVELIGRILKTVPLVGREATKNEVLERLSSVAIVHIAAHGSMETGEIALAPNTTRPSQIPDEEDFLLTMRDVMSVQIRARMVVLSCCHSGRGEIKAEGVVGIARAFLAAGARSVLVSLWAIDDEATLEFMKSFYLHLARGKSASQSLNEAMKCMRESEKFSELNNAKLRSCIW
ncbi:hypothetical protein ACROYT_G028763 [Oculina patagonica]